MNILYCGENSSPISHIDQADSPVPTNCNTGCQICPKFEVSFLGQRLKERSRSSDGLGRRHPITRQISFVMLIALVCSITNDTIAFAQSGSVAADRTASTLNVFPETITLNGARDRQSIVGQLTHDDGITEGVTEQLQFEITNPKIVKIRSGTLLPVADGTTKLKVVYGEFTKTIPVTVNNADADDALSFQLDVMPVFSKTGCNAGSCHGAARGKDGFRLSLFGYDAEGDYFRLTREMPGRRIDVGQAEDCLLINKATNKVAHSGGKRLELDSQYYAVLKRWLEEGATFDPIEIARCTSVELSPSTGLLNGTGTTQQLNVTAHYSDGTTRDVTDLAIFSTSNADVASVSQTGLVTAGSRGEGFVMARFDTHTVGSQFITLPRDLPLDDAEGRYLENNFVDAHVNAKLKRLRVYPSDVCTDAQFIRRVTIDLCGEVPTPAEVEAFVTNSDPDKRGQLIDDLIDRDEFLDLWVMKWAELLQIRGSKTVDAKAALLYFQWLKRKFYQQTPLNEIVVELLGSTGGTFENPPANFYEVDRDPLKTAENVAQVFLGMRIQCAQCHNHPFDRWTMEDYYSFAAFFAKVRSKPTADPRENVISHGGGKEIKHPVSNKVMSPKFLGGGVPKTKNKDRREALADWIVAADNPYFAKNIANMMWAHFFGRGIVDEVDDVRISNPPVNADLMAALANALVESNYNIKELARSICRSRAYQRSSIANVSNGSDHTNFSHASLRRMRAEVLLDVLTQVTATTNKFDGLPFGARSTEIPDGNTTNYFLKTFGRSTRTTACSCEVKQDPNLSQALHLLNGDTVSAKIKEGNLIGKWIRQGITDDVIARRIYLRSIAREPTAEELQRITETLNQAKPSAKQEVLEDLFWAVLNSSEFLFNH